MQIDKGIPIPQTPSNTLADAKRMEIGDSAWLPYDEAKNFVAVWRKATGFEFTSRRESGGGVRVWRIG